MKRKKPFREIEILPAMLYNMRKKMEASRKAATDKISLEDGDLDQVAGGADGDTHPDMYDSSFSEGEWCWFSDSCSYVISDYSDYLYGRKLVKEADKDIEEFEKYAEDLLKNDDFNNPQNPF